MAQYIIRPTADPGAIRVFLNGDRHYAAYALGDLEPPYAEHATWTTAVGEGGIAGIALEYAALDPPVLFLMGSLDSLEALLADGARWSRVYYTARPELETILRSYYDPVEVLHMHRMSVDRSTFHPLPHCDNDLLPPSPLGPPDVTAIFALQHAAAAADGRALHEIAFMPEMVDAGYYYGIWSGGTLIAAAGTHLVGRAARIGALGNVVVHPAHRRQGLGTRVSQAVTEALLRDGIDLIVLNVRQGNIPAIRAYTRLGYRQAGDFIEGLALRRSTASARAV